MSNRTLLEINHDYSPKTEEDAAAWGRMVRLYLRTGDKDHLPMGVAFKHMRHHSDPEPSAPDETRAGTEPKCEECAKGHHLNCPRATFSCCCRAAAPSEAVRAALVELKNAAHATLMGNNYVYLFEQLQAAVARAEKALEGK